MKKPMLKNCSVLMIMVVVLSGCAEVMYDVLQDEAIKNCQRLYEPERSACVKRNRTSYQTYREQTYDKARTRPLHREQDSEYQK